jgi:hypothetical protein
MTGRSWTCLLFGTTAIIALTACSYQHEGSPAANSYQWASLYRQDVQSVAVPIFSNKSFVRGIELSLTTALVKQLEANSPYKVASRQNADTILEGEVIVASVGTTSSDPHTSIPQEQLRSVTVSFTWKDLRNGKILVQRKDFEQSANFYPTLGEGRFVGNQQTVEKLALAIVRELQSDW